MNATQQLASNVTATWTQFQGQWMVRLSRALTKADYQIEERNCIGGGTTDRDVCYVEVSKKNGGSSIVEIGEYETKFAAKNGMPEAHIYSII